VFSIDKNSGNGPSALAGQQDVIQTISLDGTGSTTLYSVDASHLRIEYIKIAKPNLIFFSVFDYNTQQGQQSESYYKEDSDKHVTHLDSAPPGLVDGTPLPYYLQSPEPGGAE